MAKTLKKTRRMKKAVRKTLGALFLASAIVVAAIPVDGLRAAGTAPAPRASARTTNYKVTISKDKKSQATDMGAEKPIATMEDLIPVITKDDKIYITEKNKQGAIFQFAYINYNGDYVAVLLGYSGGTLVGGTLTIPEEVAAYIQPSGNMGTGYGYVAASKNGTPLYYERLTETSFERQDPILDATGAPVLDANGDPMYKTEVVKYQTGELVPCYETDDAWKDLDLAQFYFYDVGKKITSDTAKELDSNGVLQPLEYKDFSKSGQDTNYQWIKNAQVKYIGNQYLDTAKDPVSGIEVWTVGDVDPANKKDGNYISNDKLSKGVFANESNIVTLEIPDSVLGIGNGAFYNCASLQNIKLGNGVQVIGNGAFQACSWLSNVDVPSASRLGQIGDHAFYACSSLTSIQVPHVVQYIGDYAFAECEILREVELCDYQEGPSGSNLTGLGWNVFENCKTLTSLVLPEKLAETLDISIVKGCKSLQYITSRNSQLTFDEGDGIYTFQEFKTMLEGEPVNGTFFFEGLTGSKLHDLTKEKCFPFSHIIYNSTTQKYERRERYELTLVLNPDASPADAGIATFVVGFDGTEDNTLLECTLGSQVTDLTLPPNIGPKTVGRIRDNVFANKCSLKMVRIPEYMTYIGANAFKGCHNVTTVIFDNDTVRIGKDAFKTQDFSTGAVHSHAGGIDPDPANNKLCFIGKISAESTPFRYAMNMDGSLNDYSAPSQTRSFITYYSGWPENLEVQYVYDNASQSGYSELVDFPDLNRAINYLSLDKEDPKYKYIIKEHENALKGMSGSALLTAYNNNSASNEQADYVRCALNVEIPTGIQKIKDGLIYDKFEGEPGGAEKTVSIYGLDTIEIEDFHKVNAKGELVDLNGDVVKIETKEDLTKLGSILGCEKLTEVKIYGNTASIADGAFANSPDLKTVAVNGTTSRIGDYAFDNCPMLGVTYDKDPERSGYVTLSGSVSELGLCPFRDCTKLSNVSFQGDEYYTCANSIIFNADKTKIVECLPAKGKFVKPTEVGTVNDIAQEAFSGTDVQEIDLSTSDVKRVPTRAFANTSNLRKVKLPSSCWGIENYAFENSAVDTIVMGRNLTILGPDAFSKMVNAPKDVTLCSPEGSFIQDYADMNGFDWTEEEEVIYYTVIFRDWNAELGQNVQVGEPQMVAVGDDAVPPEPAGKPGERFTHWDPDYREISGDTFCTAQYEKFTEMCTVTFLDADSNPIKVLEVAVGSDVRTADLPPEPVKPGYVFTGWSHPLTTITQDIIVSPQFVEDKDAVYVVTFHVKRDGPEDEIYSVQNVGPGQSAILPQAPVWENHTFNGWWPEPINITGNMDTYAQFTPDGSVEGTRLTVIFLDHDETVLSSQMVYAGEAAVTPKDPVWEGHVFVGWRPADFSNVTENMKIYAQYEPPAKYAVTFYDYDETVLSTQYVSAGENAVIPQSPSREGYTFTGWRPSDLSNVMKDMNVYAQYEKGTGGSGGSGGSGGGDGSGSGGDGSAAARPLYTLTVRNGSGSGSYVAGSQPIVVANDPPAGQEFSNWTIDPADTKIASNVLTATVITMPERNVTVTANYKAKTTSSTSGGSTGSNTSNRPNGTTGVVSSGTTVVIDKNGLSNTGVVSATVHGSSDNFTIKVVENSAASAAVLRALQAEYGSLDNIKYFPMDISLYDAAGTKKITDTTGLKISITLPLPDSLITYAGNNKVAGVVNDKLDKLTPKFTTIDGVACVTFSAEHFSPYVIYVETNKVSPAGVTIDNTPKTGDGIHPKWFLSMGLACISAVFFLKKDKRAVQKVKPA